MAIFKTGLTDHACDTTWAMMFDFSKNKSPSILKDAAQFVVAPAMGEFQIELSNKEKQITLRCGIAKADAIPILEAMLTQLKAHR